MADARAVRIHEALLFVGATVACAESLTGGLLTAALTATPGASATLRGGLVVYATDLKASLAGVNPALLAVKGPVDPEVAAQLAAGVRERLGATYGIGVTGVAGPDVQDGKAVGTVYVAIAGPDTQVVRACFFTGDRDSIRESAVSACLDALLGVVGGAA